MKFFLPKLINGGPKKVRGVGENSKLINGGGGTFIWNLRVKIFTITIRNSDSGITKNFRNSSIGK